MTDRTTKFLLGAIALLLTCLLVRPMLAPLPAQAQSFSTSTPIQMLIDNGRVYVLSRDTLGVYEFHNANPDLPTRKGTLEEVSVKKITH